MTNQPSVCIACRKTDKAIAAAISMQTALMEAGFKVVVSQGANQVKQALLDRFYYVLIVVDKILPDENGDALLPRVNALPHPPAIFFVSTVAVDEPRGLRYDLASKGYSMDVIFRSIPLANELTDMVRRVIASFDRDARKAYYESEAK